jgi:hypothetical protein
MLSSLEVGSGVRDGTTSHHERNRLEAESVCDTEDMRPRAYQLVTEPWTQHGGGSKNNPSNSRQHQQHIQLASISCGAFPAGIRPSHDRHHCPKNNEITDAGLPSSCDWSMVSLRPTSSTTSFDSGLSNVLEYIHQDTPFFVSCGCQVRL